MDDELNDDWIRNFEKIDTLYQDFYTDDVYYINLQFIYVNRSNEIEKIKTEIFLMSTKNYITREEILQILKRGTSISDKRYSLLSILKYNILLEPEDIKHFFTSKEERNFMISVNNIDAITFDKTISVLQDLNELIIIYYEKSNELKKKNPNTDTKKIMLRSLSSRKKTIKKQYKD